MKYKNKQIKIINYKMNDQSKSQQIEEQIEEDYGMDEQFNVQFQISENPSLQINQSQVNLKKHKMVINKFGVKGNNIQINPDLIKQQSRIGKGSAGQVWLATYFKDGKQIQVAIKQIPVNEKQSRDQFVQDLKVFLTSDNPNVVKFYGCYYKQGYLNEVIQYMNLGSIRDVININKRNKNLWLGEEVLAEISNSILKGLNYIHKNKRQIHRDIKPQNILINTMGEVKITDFGICKQLQKTIGLSKTWVGTQIYMSPERIEGSTYNSNCDVWSFGLILYELATCRQLPYRKQKSSQSDYVIIQKIKKLPAPKFEASDNRSAQLSDFLSLCLQKNFEKRASVQKLLVHPWLVNKSKSNILKEYLVLVDRLSKKLNSA